MTVTAYSRKRQKRRLFVVRVGVYLAIVVGVVMQWAVQRFDAQSLELDLNFTGFTVGRIVVAGIVAVLVYRQVDGKGELDGKLAHADRALMLGFTAGFTLMGIAGIGE